eukprot:SAG31_NODE_12690_length_924_cov_0.797576_1_plen_108_part_00
MDFEERSVVDRVVVASGAERADVVERGVAKPRQAGPRLVDRPAHGAVPLRPGPLVACGDRLLGVAAAEAFRVSEIGDRGQRLVSKEVIAGSPELGAALVRAVWVDNA